MMLMDIVVQACKVLFALSGLSLVTLTVYRLTENWFGFILPQKLLFVGIFFIGLATSTRNIQRVIENDTLVWQSYLGGLGVVLATWALIFPVDKRLEIEIDHAGNHLHVEDEKVYAEILDLVNRSREVRES